MVTVRDPGKLEVHEITGLDDPCSGRGVASGGAGATGDLAGNGPVVAARSTHCVFEHGGHFDLGCPHPQGIPGCRQPLIRIARGLAHISHFGLGLDDPEIAQHPGRVGDLARCQRCAQFSVKRSVQGVRRKLHCDPATSPAFLPGDAGHEAGKVIGKQLITAKVRNPAGLGGEPGVDITHHEGGFVIAGDREHQGLRAVDSHPGVIAGKVIVGLGRHRDAHLETRYAELFPGSCETGPVFRGTECGVGG